MVGVGGGWGGSRVMPAGGNAATLWCVGLAGEHWCGEAQATADTTIGCGRGLLLVQTSKELIRIGLREPEYTLNASRCSATSGPCWRTRSAKKRTNGAAVSSCKGTHQQDAVAGCGRGCGCGTGKGSLLSEILRMEQNEKGRLGPASTCRCACAERCIPSSCHSCLLLAPPLPHSPWRR